MGSWLVCYVDRGLVLSQGRPRVMLPTHTQHAQFQLSTGSAASDNKLRPVFTSQQQQQLLLQRHQQLQQQKLALLQQQQDLNQVQVTDVIEQFQFMETMF